MARTTVYLAGKISENDWRNTLAHIDFQEDAELPTTWTPRPAGDNLLVTGPFFMRPESHSNPFGDDSHGVDASGTSGYWSNTRAGTFNACRAAVISADVFFLWLDDPTAHGSLVELGWAHALGKQIIIARPTCARTHNDRPEGNQEPVYCDYGGHCAGCRPYGEKRYGPTRDELWFADECATLRWEIWDDGTPAAPHALKMLDAHFAPKPSFGSPVEEMFWRAWSDVNHKSPFDPHPQLVPQFEFKRSNGRTFRPDFAIPSLKVAIEIDGFKYHTSPEQFADDLSRQREMERAGWRFVRFTGKEINANVMQCVHEAAEFVAIVRFTR